MLGLNNLLGMLPLESLAKQLLPEVPKYLQMITELLATEAGAQPGERTGTLFFQAKRTDGSTTTMATVYHLGDQDQPGEPIGTIDVVATINKLDLAALIAASK